MNGFEGKTKQGSALDVSEDELDSRSMTTWNADGQAGPGARSVAALLPVNVGHQQCLLSLYSESDPSSPGDRGAGKMLGDVWAYALEEGKWALTDTGGGEKPAPRGWSDADVALDHGQEAIW